MSLVVVTGAEVVDSEAPVLDDDAFDVDDVVVTGVMTILVPGFVPLGDIVEVIGAVMVPVPVYGAVIVT